MRKFSSFVFETFINQHGSHASKIPSKKGVVQEENDDAEMATKLGDLWAKHKENQAKEASKPAEPPKPKEAYAEEWHDGTPEGKQHLERLKHFFHHNDEKKGPGMHNLISHGGIWTPGPGSKYDREHNDHVHSVISPKARDSQELHTRLMALHHSDHILPEHTTAISQYTTASRRINGVLATKEPITEYRDKQIRHLDHSVVNSHPLHDKSTVTYHGTGFPIAHHIVDNPVIHSLGYISSSTMSTIAHNFSHKGAPLGMESTRNVLALHAPPGHSMLPISPNISEFPEEHEVLHPRGMLIRPRARLTSMFRGCNVTFHHADIDGVRPHIYSVIPDHDEDN